MARNRKTTTQVESIRHRDKRANIPTGELRDFMADDELAPKRREFLRGAGSNADNRMKQTLLAKAGFCLTTLRRRITSAVVCSGFEDWLPWAANRLP